MGRVLLAIICLPVLILGSSRAFAQGMSASEWSEVRPLKWEVSFLVKLLGGGAVSSVKIPGKGDVIIEGRGFGGAYLLGYSRSLARSGPFNRLGVGVGLSGQLSWGRLGGEGQQRRAKTDCRLPVRLYYPLSVWQQDHRADRAGFTWAFVEWSPWARTRVTEGGVLRSQRSGFWLKAGVGVEEPGAVLRSEGAWFSGLEAGIMVVPGLDGGGTDEFLYAQASWEVGKCIMRGSE